MSIIRTHPLVSFFVLAYGLSWAYLDPCRHWWPPHLPWFAYHALPGTVRTCGGSVRRHVAVDGKPGVVRLARRLVLVSRPNVAFLVVHSESRDISPARVGRGNDRADAVRQGHFAMYSGLPPAALPVVVLLVLLSGFGEETGWRGLRSCRYSSDWPSRGDIRAGACCGLLGTRRRFSSLRPIAR